MLRRTLLLATSLFLVAGTFAVDLAEAQRRQVRGIVRSITGEPIAGATVTVKGTTISKISSADGTFAIEVPRGQVVLRVSTLGYRTVEVTVGPDESTVSVDLPPDPLALEEIVVTGRATGVSRANLPNSVSTVNAEEMERAPAQSVEKSIQGKVAGAVIESNSGAPGGGIQVRLRGASSINAQASPLYVVDGVIVSDVAIPNNQNEVTESTSGSNPAQTQDNQVNRIADLNPSDIERIEVLKGASAAAIYGQKASNGVVVITTKRGRPGAPRVRLSQRFGFFDLSNTIGLRRFDDVEDAVGTWGEGAREFFDEAGNPIGFFDHEELLGGRNKLSFETSASVSGGTETTQYFASALWKNDEGIINNTGFEKQSLRVNLTQQLGDRVELQASTNLMHTVANRGLSNNDNSGTSYWLAITEAPTFVNLERDPETGVFPESPFGRSNPFQTAALSTNDEDVWRFLGSISGTWNAIQGRSHNVRVLANFGVDWFGQENELVFPPELEFEPADGLPGTSLLSESDNLNLNVGANLVYRYSPADGDWTATTSAGFQYEDRDLNIARVTSRNLNAGNPNIDAGTVISVRESREKVRDQGFYLQEEWLGVNERLLISAGGRFDRSSTVGPEGTFFFYPKAAASYRFRDLTGAIADLKFRVAWGQSGNLPLFGQKFTNVFIDQNVEGIPGLLLSDTLGAADITPERQNEVEGGFDLSLWDGRASLEFTAYQKNITDLILTRTTASSLGFRQEILNGGELRVRGIEAALAATPIQNEGLTWLFRTTFFLDRGKILDLPVPSFRAGGFSTTLGAFQIEEGASPTQIVGRIVENEQSRVAKLGDATPDFKMTFSNDLTFGRFNVYSLFDWRAGGEVINLTNLLFDATGNTGDFVDAGLNRITTFAGGDIRPYIESATYLKLRELSVSYTLPRDLTTSWFGGVVQSAQLTFSARDLLRFTGYSGLDPEVSNFGNQAVGRNVAVTPFPPSRSFWFGLDLTL